MYERDIGLAVIGCGGFGLFALQHFTQLPGVSLRAMAGTHPSAAEAAALRLDVAEERDFGSLLARPDVEVVYIATPPFLHYEQAVQALGAGKHVIVEKPLALTVAQAQEMSRLARERELLLVANLMQRYNPVFDAISRLIQSKFLGEILHGYFENYAADENLPPSHWFWDRSKSGGIFVEHAVHFFDLFEGWLGPGAVLAARRVLRPPTGLEEQASCSVAYPGDVLVNFYHGFHQPNRMDRQEMRLLFERGDVTIYDWIPTRVVIRAIAAEKDAHHLCSLFPGARLDVDTTYSPRDRACQGRHKQLDVYEMFTLTYGEGHSKMHRYGELLRAFFADQLAWVRNRTHQRKITERNGLSSLRTALEAVRLADTTP